MGYKIIYDSASPSPPNWTIGKEGKQANRQHVATLVSISELGMINTSACPGIYQDWDIITTYSHSVVTVITGRKRQLILMVCKAVTCAGLTFIMIILPHGSLHSKGLLSGRDITMNYYLQLGRKLYVVDTFTHYKSHSCIPPFHPESCWA